MWRYLCLFEHHRPKVMGKTMADEEFLKALDSTGEIQLTVTGRRGGREISIPVWFVREGNRLYLVPVRGSDSDWYKKCAEGADDPRHGRGSAAHRARDPDHGSG